MENMPIPGWGIDRRIAARPGYPLEQEHHVDHDTLGGLSPCTETIPLRGLSGVMRRLAYQYPDWRPRRGRLLRFADRVDTLESKLTPRNLAILGGIASLGAGLRAWARARRKQTIAARAFTRIRSLG